MDARFALLRHYIERVALLTDEDWEMLLPHLTIKKLKKHQLFCEFGKQAQEVGFVLEGTFRQFYVVDGDEKTTYFFFENHVLSSYISCISHKPSQITIEALSDATYIGFPYRVLSELFDQSMNWQRFGRLIAEYLMTGLEERLVSVLLRSPEERYLELLAGNKAKIIQRVPQHFIASYLGITSVSMSRIRNRVAKK